MPFGLEDFKQSAVGQMIGQIIHDADTLVVMRYLSRQNTPAVEAIGRQILALGVTLTYQQRKLVGRWVREIMWDDGWEPYKSARVAPGNLFSTGAVYRTRTSDIPLTQEDLES